MNVENGRILTPNQKKGLEKRLKSLSNSLVKPGGQRPSDRTVKVRLANPEAVLRLSRIVREGY